MPGNEILMFLPMYQDSWVYVNVLRWISLGPQICLHTENIHSDKIPYFSQN